MYFDWFAKSDQRDPIPVAILDKRMMKFHNVAQVQYLVQWEGFQPHESTWEVAEDFVV